MSKLKRKFMTRVMAVILSGSMVLSNMSVFAAELSTEETEEAELIAEEAVSETEEPAAIKESAQVESAAWEMSIAEDEESAEKGSLQESVAAEEATSSAVEEKSEETTITAEETMESASEKQSEETTMSAEETTESVETKTEEMISSEEKTIEEETTEEETTEGETIEEETTVNDETDNKEAADGVYVFNPSEMDEITASSDNEGREIPAGTGNCFTMVLSSKTSIQKTDAAFDDGSVFQKRLAFGGTYGSKKNYIAVTVKQDAKIKIWWDTAGNDTNGRSAAIRDTDGVVLKESSKAYTKGTNDIFEYYVGQGTYRISGNGSICIYKIEVTEGAKNPVAEAKEYTFDVAEMGVIADFSALETKSYTSKDGYFTVYYGDAGKTDTNSKEFPDGYKNTHRLSLNEIAVTSGSVKGAVGFTTAQDDAKVKVWWRCAGTGRKVVIYDANGARLDEGIDDGTYNITTFTLTTAGTYYIGNEGGNNWISKISVKEGKEESTAWSDVAEPKIQSTVQNGGKIDVTVEVVIDEIAGADRIEIEMYDSNKKLVASEKSAKSTKDTATVSFAPTASGDYTFIAKAFRETEEKSKDSAESTPFHFVLPLKAPTSFSGRNMGGGDIEIGYGEVPEADSYVISAVEAVETTDAEGKKSYQKKEGAEPASYPSTTTKVQMKGLSLDTYYIFTAYAVRKGTGPEGADEAGPVSEEFAYKILDRSEYAWAYRTFGQSTSTKYNGYEGNANDGTVTVWCGQNPKESADGKMHQAGKLVDHLGISYYYTELEKDQNFVLEATATVNSWFWNGGESFALMAADDVGEHGDSSIYYDNICAVGGADISWRWNGSEIESVDNYSEGAVKYRMSNGVASIVRQGVTDGWRDGGASEPPGFVRTDKPLEISVVSNGQGQGGTYNMIGNYVDEYGEFNGPAPNKGENVEPLLTTFKLRLEKNNTGYIMTYIDPNGEEHTEICYDESIWTEDYDNNMMLQMNKEHIYVGFMTTREMNATFSDIKLTTSKAGKNGGGEPPMEKPKTYSKALYSVMSSKVSNKPDYDFIFTTNWEGTLSIQDASGRELVNKDYYKYLSETMTTYRDKNTNRYKEISYLEKCFDVGTKDENGRYSNVTYDDEGNIISAKVKADSTKILIPINEKLNTASMLSIGANKFTINFTPDRNWHMNDDESHLLADYSKWTYDFNVTYGKYGAENNNIYVAPSDIKESLKDNIVNGLTGKPTGDGTKGAPLDIRTAIKHVQPGQTIVLAKGRYSFTNEIIVAKGIDGRADAPIRMVAEPGSYDRTQPFKASGVVFDFNGVSTGMTLNGSYWHLKGFDITHTADKQKGLQISGSYNVIDQINTYYNGNTGIQIARGNGADNDISDWPSYNTVKNCTSYNNSDSAYEDADGFAAKLTIGMGNVFDGCISAFNSDDGWDLYAKSATGPIGQVVIKNCIAFKNGWVRVNEDEVLDIYGSKEKGTGNGNGFKMGGESISGHHILLNSYAFGNKAKGIDNNSCPDIQAYNSISFNNEAENISLAVKANASPNSDFRMQNVISFKTDGDGKDGYGHTGTQVADYYINDTTYLSGKNKSGKTVAADWFESLDFVFQITDSDGSQSADSTIKRNSDGTIQMGNGFL